MNQHCANPTEFLFASKAPTIRNLSFSLMRSRNAYESKQLHRIIWCGTIGKQILLCMVVYTAFRHIRSGAVLYIQVHTENDRFRNHGQILPTLRQLHSQNSESRIRQTIFLAGETTSIQKKFFSNLTFSTVIPSLIFPLILGL